MASLVKDICGWIGSAIAMFFYISPVVPLIKVMKKEININEFPGILLLMSLMNCLLWCVYGIFIHEIPSWLCNGAGAATTLIWLIIYWIYFADCKWVPALVYNVLMINVVAEIFYLCYAVAGEEYFETVGWIAMVFNILMYAAPGEKIYRVIQTNNHNLIPIFSVIAGVFCSSFWGIFGLIIGKLSMIIPNVLGAVLSVLQIIVWTIYRVKNKDPLIPIVNDITNNNDALMTGDK